MQEDRHATTTTIQIRMDDQLANGVEKARAHRDINRSNLLKIALVELIGSTRMDGDRGRAIDHKGRIEGEQ